MSGALLTLPEVAEVLGRSPTFVRGLVADGVLAAERQRGRWYVKRAVLDAWLAPVSPEKPEPRFARRVEVRRRG